MVNSIGHVDLYLVAGEPSEEACYCYKTGCTFSTTPFSRILAKDTALVRKSYELTTRCSSCRSTLHRTQELRALS